MPESLKGRSVLVTGGSKGIGKGIARVFANAGATVAILARYGDQAEAAAKEIGKGSFGLAGDVTQLASLEAAVKSVAAKNGGLDVLCANAGIFPPAKLEEMSVEQWDEVIDTNLKGTFLSVKAAVPYLKESDQGRIVITSSITGPVTGFPGWTHYGATKAGQLGFMRTARIEAVRYAGRGAQVTVDLEDAGTTARLSVRDTGVGIGPELLPRIFDQFTQGAQGLARSAGGLGIGLALVRTIVSMHGGKVRAHSDGPGHGAQSVVELPATSGPVAAVTAPALAPAPPSTLRILVVDDNADSAEMLSVVLQQWGHDVRVAGDGESALTEVARFHPQVVLLDIGLPGMSDYAVAERLSHAEGTRPVLIALTGYGQGDDIKRAGEAGFDRHILKPVDFVRLREALADTEGRKTAARGAREAER